jgi:hypothetical protein
MILVLFWTAQEKAHVVLPLAMSLKSGLLASEGLETVAVNFCGKATLTW